jgi:polyphosphate kinase 2 (PPK2 family)
MSKKSKSAKKARGEQAIAPEQPAQTAGDSTAAPAKKLSNKAYLKELEKLEAELVHLQSWVIKQGLKVILVFEGRDAAGKGGTIKAITGRVSPRVFQVGRPAGAERPREDADVRPALPAALSGGRRSRHLRP